MPSRRVHVDLDAKNPEVDVTRVIGLGAREVERHSSHGLRWIVFTDPEGNYFCIRTGRTGTGTDA